MSNILGRLEALLGRAYTAGLDSGADDNNPEGFSPGYVRKHPLEELREELNAILDNWQEPGRPRIEAAYREGYQDGAADAGNPEGEHGEDRSWRISDTCNDLARPAAAEEQANG